MPQPMPQFSPPPQQFEQFTQAPMLQPEPQPMPFQMPPQLAPQPEPMPQPMPQFQMPPQMAVAPPPLPPDISAAPVEMPQASVQALAGLRAARSRMSRA
jgi:hypothetical protein